MTTSPTSTPIPYSASATLLTPASRVTLGAAALRRLAVTFTLCPDIVWRTIRIAEAQQKLPEGVTIETSLLTRWNALGMATVAMQALLQAGSYGSPAALETVLELCLIGAEDSAKEADEMIKDFIRTVY